MSRGVVAAGHPLTAQTGAWALREGGNAVDAAIAAVASSCVTESPLTGLGAGGYMLVHDASGTTVLDFFVAAPGAEGVERRSELVPIEVHFTPVSSQVFNVGAASCGVPGTPAGLVEAARAFGTMPLAELVAPAARQARDGVELSRRAGVLRRDPRPDPHQHRGGRRDLRPRRTAARAPVTASDSPTSATRSSGSARTVRAVLRRRHRRRDQRLGAGARRDPRPRRPRRLCAGCPRAGRGGLSRQAGADQPAALSRRRPDRLRPRAPLTTREQRRRGARRGDGSRSAGADRGVRRLAGRRRLRREIPRRPARLDHPHHRRRRRGDVCQRHLLERHRLGDDRSRHRRPRQQHARRAGPEPARLPPLSGRAGDCRR